MADAEPGSGESVSRWYTGTRKRDPFILIRLTRAIYYQSLALYRLTKDKKKKRSRFNFTEQTERIIV